MSTGEVDVYSLGETFSPKLKEAFMPFIVAINSMASAVYLRCLKYAAKFEHSVVPTTLGDGVVAGVKTPDGVSVGIYMGVLEIKKLFDKLEGRRFDYVMDLPALKLPTGEKIEVVLCGFKDRHVTPNASILNNACVDYNTLFFLEEIDFYKNFTMRQKVAFMEKDPSEKPKITKRMRSQAQEILFSYVVVVAVTTKEVLAGDQILVSYNRPGKKITTDSYLTTRAFAEASCKPHEEVLPCRCGPAGICPKSLFFLKPREDVAGPAMPPA